MQKNTLWFLFVLLVMYLMLVFCDGAETRNQSQSQSVSDFSTAIISSPPVMSEDRDLVEESRTRKRHRFFHLWGWHALAIAYWIKVKVVIVSFFLGSAVFLGLRYFWPHKCNSAISHDGPIYFDNPHSFSNHDHIPYSLDHSDHFGHGSFDHSYESSNIEPYSAYAGSVDDSEPPSSAPDNHRLGRRRRSPKYREVQTTEEQIAEFMFSFLGLDSRSCRQRFICEMEFRSLRNPLTSMAFRIVGRGFFEKYTNVHNTVGRAQNFTECATVNPECVFIEQNIDDSDDDAEDLHDQGIVGETTTSPLGDDLETAAASPEAYSENNVLTVSDDAEKKNRANLMAERLVAFQRKRGDRELDVVAKRILNQQLNES